MPTDRDGHGDVLAPPSSDQGTAWPTYVWGGRMHPVPEGWRFPGGPALDIFLLWHFGSRGNPMFGPLRTLSKHDVSRVDYNHVSKCKGVFTRIEQLARAKGLLAEGDSVRSLPKSQVVGLFTACYAVLVQELYGVDGQTPRGREGELEMSTLYARMLKKRKLHNEIPVP